MYQSLVLTCVMLGIPALEKLMADLTVHHKSSEVAPVNFIPRSNDIVSAKFTFVPSFLSLALLLI